MIFGRNKKVKDINISNVESVEDNEENENSQVLKDQHEQFTRVVVLDDIKNYNASHARDGVHLFPFALCLWSWLPIFLLLVVNFYMTLYVLIHMKIAHIKWIINYVLRYW